MTSRLLKTFGASFVLCASLAGSNLGLVATNAAPAPSIYTDQPIDKVLFGLEYEPLMPNSVLVKAKSAVTNFQGSHFSNLYLRGQSSFGFMKLVDTNGKEVEKTPAGKAAEHIISGTSLNYWTRRHYRRVWVEDNFSFAMAKADILLFFRPPKSGEYTFTFRMILYQKTKGDDLNPVILPALSIRLPIDTSKSVGSTGSALK